MTSNYREGSTIIYNSHGGIRTVLVTRKWEETAFYKDEGPGFDGTLIEDEKSLVWGFDSTILSVVEY